MRNTVYVEIFNIYQQYTYNQMKYIKRNPEDCKHKN